ncbi:MAG: hypothetical protein ACTSRZ_08030 [Promethearchaeota archaeon]
MRRNEDNVYEIDVIDVIAMIFGTSMIIYGFMTDIILLLFGLAVFSLIIWGNIFLKIISIIFAIITFFSLNIILSIIDVVDFIRLSFGVKVFLANYLSLWPIIISGTISIFAVLYAIKEQRFYLNMSIIVFFISSGIISLYNSIRMVNENQLSTYIIFWLINFSIYLFAYILTFTIFYIAIKGVKVLSYRFTKLFEKNSVEKSGSNKIESSKKSGKKASSKVMAVNYSNEIIESDISEDLEPLYKIYYTKKVETTLKIIRGLVLITIGVLGIIFLPELFNIYQDKYLPNLDLYHQYLIEVHFISAIVISIILIPIGIQLAIMHMVKFKEVGPPLIIEALVLGLVVRFTNFYEDIEGIEVWKIFSLIFIGIFIFLTYIYGWVKRTEILSKKFDPFIEIIVPIGFGLILCIAGLLVTLVIINNENLIEIKIMVVIAMTFIFFSAGLSYIIGGLIIKPFNKYRNIGGYIFAIKSAIDLIIISSLVGIYFYKINKLETDYFMAPFIIYIITGCVTVLYYILYNIILKEKVVIESEKVSYSQMDNIKYEDQILLINEKEEIQDQVGFTYNKNLEKYEKDYMF